MAGIVFPLGAPRREEPFPGPDGALDTELLQQQAGIRRRRSPFEPPEDTGIVPRIVPRNLFRAAQAEDIRTRADALSVRHSALDLGFNAEADSLREGLSRFRTSDDLLTPEARIEEMSSPNVSFIRNRSLTAIAEMRRASGGPEIWTPGPIAPPQPDHYLDHLGVVAQRAGWAYRGAPSGGDGTEAIKIEQGWLDRLKGVASRIAGVPGVVADVLPIREIAAMQEVSTNPLGTVAGLVLHRGESAATLTRAANAVGSSFNGKEFWRSVWVNGGAGIASGFGTVGDFEAYRLEAEDSFAKHWAELPRPAQLFAEELNPANVALALVGGPLAGVLKGSGVRGAKLLAGLIEPLAQNPLKAVALAVGSNVASRGAYEATEGAPGVVRVGAALAAGGGVIAAEQGAERGGLKMLRAIDDFLGDAPASRQSATLASTILPGFTPEQRAVEMERVRTAYRAKLEPPTAREYPTRPVLATGPIASADPTAMSHAELNLALDKAAGLAYSREGKPGSELFEADYERLLTEYASRGGAPGEAQRYYQPGRVVEGYGGLDKVIAFDPTKSYGSWAVQVQRVAPDGSPLEAPRWHSTMPSSERLYPEIVKPTIGEMARVAVDENTSIQRLAAEPDLVLRRVSEYRDEARRALEGPETSVGFARASDLPLTLRSALGNGGVIKAGHPDEMLNAATSEVMTEWRSGETLAARFLPGNLALRARRPAGSKLTVIPDVLPVPRPATVRNVVHQPTLTAGTSLSETLTTATERAGDLAAQIGTTVPTGPMHSIVRAEAALPKTGVMSRPINWFNQASNDPVLRTAAIAQKMTRSEMASRVAASREQFLGRVREVFGSTDRLPERIEYIGPATRQLFGAQEDAIKHPLTGTIRDFFENPQFYNDDIGKYLPEFLAFDERNTAISKILVDEFGVPVGEFDTGIASSLSGGRGVFFPNYDAGVGRVARGHEGAVVSPGSSLRERVYATMTERLAEADQVLTKPVTDLGETFRRLDETKIRRAQLETFRYAIGGSKTERPGWQEIAPLEQVTGEKVWLPPEQATAAANWLTSKESGLANFFEDIKNTRLGGDASPLTIQGSIGWALSPVDSARDILEGLGRGIVQGNPLRPFTNEAMYQDIAAAPERWVRFFTYMGNVPAGGTPAEWRTGFLESLPLIGGKIAQLNDGMTNALSRGMESTFNEFGTTLLQQGVPENEAWAAAADVMKMGWLQQNFDQLGVPVARRSIERGGLTSTTFIRQPLNFMTTAATGYAKLAASPARLFGTAGQWAELTPRETLAVHAFTKMAGTFTGMAAVSAAVTAEDRGWTPEQALERAVLDVGGPDWMTLWLSKDVKIPLGGPYRALLRAAAPQEFLGYEHVPFGGVARFLTSRVTTGAQVGVDLIQNEDFYGNKIATEEGVRGLGQALAYTAANVVPVALGVPYQAQRAGQPFSEGVREVAFQYLGQNPLVASQREVLERERRLGARALFDQGVEGRRALGMAPEQAAVDAPTLAQLRNAIGTRAANAAAELANPATAGAREAYIADLRRRSDLGDRDAEALLISVDAQERLQALAQNLQVDGVLDKTAYRTSRGPIIDQMVGRSTAFQETFSKMRMSDSPVDRASAEWYDLFDKATAKVEMNGRLIPTQVDYAAFDQMEAQFFAAMDPQLAALVQQNISVAPLGGGPAEIELRQVRRDLTLSGYWRIDDELWATMKPNLLKTNLVPEAVQERAGEAATFTEYRAAIVEELTRVLVRQGFQPETAAQFAKSRFDARPEAQVFGAAMIERKAEWASAHAQDGLAEQAIQWGYLSDSFTNLILSGVAEGNRQRRGEPAPVPTPVPSAPVAPPGGMSGTRPLPKSANIEVPLNERLLAEHESGLSYGQIAIKYDLSRDAVAGRVKRQREAGGAPEMLATFVRNDDGGIVGMQRAQLRIVRDENGRPIGIGKSA